MKERIKNTRINKHTFDKDKKKCLDTEKVCRRALANAKDMRLFLRF